LLEALHRIIRKTLPKGGRLMEEGREEVVGEIVSAPTWHKDLKSGAYLFWTKGSGFNGGIGGELRSGQESCSTGNKRKSGV